LLLLKMADYLTSHSRMEESMIGEYVQLYSKEVWVRKGGFIKKENYYQFNTALQEQLKILNEKDSELITEANKKWNEKLR
jgi:hypothetical protein